MRRTTPVTFDRLRRTGAYVVTLTVAAAGILHAQKTSAACNLLQVAELEAALGGKASGKPTGAIQTVPGMTLDECDVTLTSAGAPHPVSVRIVTDLPMDGAEAITSRNTGTARETQWKAAGARLEQGKVGNAMCILTGRPNVPSHTTCSVPRGKGFVEIDVRGSVSDLPSIATVGALAQKATARR